MLPVLLLKQLYSSLCVLPHHSASAPSCRRNADQREHEGEACISFKYNFLQAVDLEAGKIWQFSNHFHWRASNYFPNIN